MFQPNELNNSSLTYEERRHPIDFKRTKISIKLPDNVSEKIGDDKDKKSPKEESIKEHDKDKKTKENQNQNQKKRNIVRKMIMILH